jgi:hypothetical protein
MVELAATVIVFYYVVIPLAALALLAICGIASAFASAFEGDGTCIPNPKNWEEAARRHR